MAYRATDPAMLNAIKPGDRVNFTPDRVNGRFTITKIEGARWTGCFPRGDSLQEPPAAPGEQPMDTTTAPLASIGIDIGRLGSRGQSEPCPVCP
jgi:hypothetical protein